MDAGNVSAIISAASGLTGVIIGVVSTTLNARRVERIRDQRDTSYLAILVVSHLDRFANGCTHVAFDDGTSEGQPAGPNGEYRPTVTPPTFAPLDIEVEWKVLPRKLMYDILELPDKQAHLENQLAGVAQFETLPDYGEYFWRRQRDYAELALKVFAVAKELRKFAELPIDEGVPGDWNLNVAMQKAIEKIDKERAAWEKRRDEEWAKVKPPPVPPAPSS